MIWPIVIHMECGYKILLHRHGAADYWRRFSNTPGTYLQCGGPL